MGSNIHLTEQQHAAESLQEGAARLRSTLDRMLEGCQIIGWDWRYSYVNATAAEHGRRTPRELIGHSMTELYPGIEKTEVFGALRRCMEDRTPRRMETQFTFPDNSRGVFELSIEPVPEGILVLSYDITERKRNEDAARESEALKQDVLNSLPAHIAVLDRDGTIIAINEAWQRFARENSLAVPRTGIGTNYLDVCRKATAATAADADKALAGIQSVLDGSQESFSSEYACHSPLTERWFLMSVTPLSRPGGGAVVCHLDITARKQGELARSRLAAIVESSTDAIIGRTLDGTITDWNKGAEAMLGYTAEEMSGQPFSIFVPPDRINELRRMHELIQRGKVVPPFETTRMRKDGTTIDVAITVSPIRDANGNITGAAAILRDITERKRLEKEVLEISEREQSRIGQDLHDGLCQHLAGIEFRLLGLKQKLAGKFNKLAPEVIELARLVRDGIEQTRTLARGLSPVMLEERGLMNGLQELALSTQKAFNVACSLHCPAPVLIHDNAVATHLYRIAQEAVQNALRHGKARSIVIHLLTQNDRIVLGVKDDGAGFPRKPRKHKGMGLRIMQYRAGMVGGSLIVQPEPAGGTSVICSLRPPRRKPPRNPGTSERTREYKGQPITSQPSHDPE